MSANEEYEMRSKSQPQQQEDHDFEAKHPSDVIGNWGPVQLVLVVVITIGYFVAPFSNVSVMLFSPNLNFTCHYMDGNQSYALLNKCEYNLTNGETTHKCTNFTYDHSKYKRSLVDQFDLVCDRSWYSSFSQSLHQIGYAISGLLLGFVSDRFGRLTAASFCIALETVAGFGQAFAPNIYWFWFSRLFVGIAAYGRFLSGFVLMTEWIGPKLRARILTISELGWQFGYVVFLAATYYYPDFKVIQITISTFEIFFFILYIMFVLESPRFLLMHSKHKKLDQVLRSAAVARGKLSNEEISRRIESIKANSIKELQEEKDAHKKTVFDVWKVPILLKLSLILYYTWFTHAFIGYASVFNTVNFGGDLLTNLGILAAADAIAFIIILSIINRIQRTTAMLWGIVIETIALVVLLASSFRDEDLWLRIMANIVFRCSGSLVVQAYYMYSAETFPTAMRQASLGTCSLFARCGSVIAPFVKELTNVSHLSVSFAIFLSLSIINLFLILFIPDTSKIQVADTINQKKREVETKVSSQLRSMSLASASLSIHF